MPAQQPSPTYIHSLTTAFASTLDEIPQDMCRHFADLRELDAVLSQSLSSITTRIEHLTERIEGGLVSLKTQDEPTATEATENADSGPTTRTAKEEEVISMFQMLHEIADETSRIKLGGEDKIRVASLAAEHMNAYYVHLLAITRRMYDIDEAYAPEILQPYTMYPHVPPSALVDPTPENRRGQPKRGAAALNSRNDSINRMNGGDTPNKRRRPQGAQPYTQNRDADTDDYSTPRRGPAALDADAYRPGGNTASKARTQNRKPRETRVISQNPMDNAMATDLMDVSRPGSGMPGGNSMQGVESTNNMQNQASVSNHKSQGHGGRGRTGVSSQHHLNPNPQPQPFPVSYGYGSSRNARMPYEGQPGAPYDPMGPSTYPPNANPMMDVYNHHGGMNMNPNLNHIPPSNHSHVNLPLPTTLPPPPSGRTSSANVSSRPPYELPASEAISGSRYAMPNGSLDPLAGASPYHPSSTKSSHRASEVSIKEREFPPSAPPVSSGLMPVPMLTSLPPVTSLNQSTALNMPPIPPITAREPGNQPRSRGYSHSTYNYGPVDPLPGGPAYSHTQPGYQSKSNVQSSGHPSTNFNTTGAGSGLERRTTSKSEAQPSLSSSSGPSKELPPLNTHIRDYATGGSSAGASASAMHASLARDPPFRTGSAGSGERTDREPKSASMSSRPRSGTVGADSNRIPSAEHAMTRQAGSPTHPVEHGDSDRDNAPGGSSRYSDGRYIGQWMGGKEGPSSHAVPQSQIGWFDRGGKDEPIERLEERDRSSVPNTGVTKRPNIDHLLDSGDNRVPERHEYSRTSSGGKVGDSGPMEPLEDRPIKAPVRRKPIDDDGNRPFGEPASSDARDQDDDKPYCFCGQPSFGEMIACDDSECEYEWFHLQCLGITGTPPRGDFVCPSCKLKRTKGNKKPLKKKGTTGNGKGRNL